MMMMSVWCAYEIGIADLCRGVVRHLHTANELAPLDSIPVYQFLHGTTSDTAEQVVDKLYSGFAAEKRFLDFIRLNIESTGRSMPLASLVAVWVVVERVSSMQSIV
jgi:hypothetical protein